MPLPFKLNSHILYVPYLFSKGTKELDENLNDNMKFCKVKNTHAILNTNVSNFAVMFAFLFEK